MNEYHNNTMCICHGCLSGIMIYTFKMDCRYQYTDRTTKMVMEGWVKKMALPKCFMISVLVDGFTETAVGCVPNDLKLNDIYNFYAEINLSGCKYLCKYLHNNTCTLVMFLPDARSCILLPLQNISFADEKVDCRRAEIYRRYRMKGNAMKIN